MSQRKSSRYTTQGHSRRAFSPVGEQSFTCAHCGLTVLCDPTLAGVQNRNHCPYCLWSRHLDWREAGDRLSACRAPMEPVGLTTKRGRNKYARERDGELMLIHRCTACGTTVINRIAADDSDRELLVLFVASCRPTPGFRAELTLAGIDILTEADHDLVHRRLLGAGRRGGTGDALAAD